MMLLPIHIVAVGARWRSLNRLRRSPYSGTGIPCVDARPFALILFESDHQHTTNAPDWTPKGLCKQ